MIYFIVLLGTLCSSVYTMSAQSTFAHVLSENFANCYFCETSFCDWPVSHRRPSATMLGVHSHLWSQEALHLDKSFKISSLVANRGLLKHLVKVGRRNALSLRWELNLHAWLPLVAPFPSGWDRSWSEERNGYRPLAVMLSVISCFQQLCPSIQGVTDVWHLW